MRIAFVSIKVVLCFVQFDGNQETYVSNKIEIVVEMSKLCSLFCLLFIKNNIIVLNNLLVKNCFSNSSFEYDVTLGMFLSAPF